MFSIINIKNHANVWRGFILDAIFPIECVSCSLDGVWLCPDCFQKLFYKDGQYCLGCKITNDLGQFCLSCRQEYDIDGILIAGDYEDKLLAQLIKLLKYHFIKDIAQILSEYLLTFIEKEQIIDSSIFNALILPVPLHRRRELWRGFNQAQLIADNLSNSLCLETDHKNLVRIKNNQPQVKFEEVRRKSNILDCFEWRGEPLNGRNIIIIDDIVTTGATLNECAKVLKQNGAGKVWGLVVAKG